MSSETAFLSADLGQSLRGADFLTPAACKLAPFSGPVLDKSGSSWGMGVEDAAWAGQLEHRARFTAAAASRSSARQQTIGPAFRSCTISHI